MQSTGRSEWEKTKRNESQPIDPLTISIAETARITGESEWTVKNKLRLGTYQARKSGRRTLVVYASVKEANEALPEAKFAPPTRVRGQT